ncbi:uncharacterized protein LOC120280330 [Dioscorea cayenensis subsp. rotundata]|uniref:Uncharacterized protein LOC120280330 n=1 Tax=Dioscorea cayennensis subsp. rotundata TaxID=55577 RepID=A0AB40CWV9_DIOCR|nr:uncharacterized protein LOC120280330 [Dioscorea cayenensis subsp. rotundata]
MPTWSNVRREVLARFAGALAANPYEALATVKQNGSVDLYIRDFIEKSAQIQSWQEEAFTGQFLNGLREEIRAHIRSHETKDLYATMTLAQENEHELELVTKKTRLHSSISTTFGLGSRAGVANAVGRSLVHSFGSSAQQSVASSLAANASSRGQGNWAPLSRGDKRIRSKVNSKTSSVGSSTNSPAHPATSARIRRVRQYTQKKFQDLRSKGLCFCCHQPYNSLHQRPNKSLRTLTLGDEELNGESPCTLEFNEQSQDSPSEDASQLLQLELPYFSMTSTQQPSTLKFLGKIGQFSVIVMVDSGASHCFISNTTAKLQIPISSTPKFGVRLGDGH